MKRVLTSESLAEVNIFKHVLEEAGIECTIRNEQLTGGLGDIPVLDCLPELWVLDDTAAERAEAVIDKHRKAPPSDAPPWICTNCGESNEPQFGACWQCEQPAA